MGNANRPMLNAKEKFNINRDVKHKLKYKKPMALILSVIGSLIFLHLDNINGATMAVILPVNSKI